MPYLLPKLSSVRQEQYSLTTCISVLTFTPSSTKLAFNLQFLFLEQSCAQKYKKIHDKLLKMRVWLPKGACLNLSLLFRISSLNINIIVIVRLYLQRGFTAGPTPALKKIDEFSFLMY